MAFLSPVTVGWAFFYYLYLFCDALNVFICVYRQLTIETHFKLTSHERIALKSSEYISAIVSRQEAGSLRFADRGSEEPVTQNLHGTNILLRRRCWSAFAHGCALPNACHTSGIQSSRIRTKRQEHNLTRGAKWSFRLVPPNSTRRPVRTAHL